MKVIKKDGTLEDYNEQKIVNAVHKSAARAMVELTESQYADIVARVNAMVYDKFFGAVPVAEMHNMVEKVLDDVEPRVAKSYRDYRNYKKDFVHLMDKVYQLSLIHI